MHADCVDFAISDDTLDVMEARGIHDVACPHCDGLLERQTGQVWKCTNCGKQCLLQFGERDPRIDPQCGDVLAVGNDVREVVARVQGSTVEYSFPGKAATRWLNLLQWQIWARDAEVREAAA